MSKIVKNSKLHGPILTHMRAVLVGLGWPVTVHDDAATIAAAELKRAKRQAKRAGSVK